MRTPLDRELRRPLRAFCLAFAVWIACAFPCAALTQTQSKVGPLAPQEPELLTGSFQYAGSYQYDAAGRLVRAVLADLSTIHYTYDLSGNLVRVRTTNAPVKTVGLQGGRGDRPAVGGTEPRGLTQEPAHRDPAALAGLAIGMVLLRRRRAAVVSWPERECRGAKAPRSGPVDGDQHEPARGPA